MTAAEIMTERVTTIDSASPLGDALRIMQDEGIRHLPVTDGPRLIGMISDRDLQSLGLRLVSDLQSLERVDAQLSSPVSAVMSSNLLTAARETELVELADLFIDEKVGAVPVVDEGALVGIVSVLDLLRAWRDDR